MPAWEQYILKKVIKMEEERKEKLSEAKEILGPHHNKWCVESVYLRIRIVGSAWILKRT